MRFRFTARLCFLCAAFAALLAGVRIAGAAAPESAASARDLSFTDSARYTVAAADLAALENALTLCEIYTGYYTPLENLDDATYSNPLDDWQNINHRGGALLLDLDTGEFRPTRLFFDAITLWPGPFVTYQRTAGADGAGYDPGSPLDPWGQPYLLFSPLGLVWPEGPYVTLESYGDAFDRWAVVCLGRDMRTGGGDDLIREFGRAPSRLAVSAVRVISAAASRPLETQADGAQVSSWALEFRGYNFGAAQADSAVLVDGAPLALPASEWSARRVVQPLPADLAVGAHEAALRVGGASSRAFSFVYQGEITAAATCWTFYE